MATETFPAYMVLSHRGYSESMDDAIYRTPMESGPPKQLAKQSRALIKRSVTYVINSKANYLNWQTFVKTNLVNGSNWFNWTDPVNGVVKLARIEGGRYRATPWSPIIDVWDIDMTLETWSA